MLQPDDILGIIPARMASARFPGKPLVLIHGIPMVIRVWQEASRILPNLVIASGDEEIGTIARQYGAGFILTRQDHPSGTSRCIEAMKSWSATTGKQVKAVLNIQGDEPLVTREAIAALTDDISSPDILISTLIRAETDQAAFRNPNRVKVVFNVQGFALYFSRSAIPWYRNEGSAWYSHVGMYAFKKEAIEEIAGLKPGPLEKAESLEQLGWMENGFPIHCCITEYAGFGIDTPEDLEVLLKSGLG